MNLYTASRQWSNRPSDERFWNLADLRSHLETERDRNFERPVDLRSTQIVANGDDLCLSNGKGQAQLSNWAFTQLCNKMSVPGYYLRDLPAKLAATNLNHGLSKLDEDKDSKILLHKNGGWLVRSINSGIYGRLWNLDIVRGLSFTTENGWMTPPARPAMKDSRARKATKDDILPNQDDFGLSVKEGDMIAPAGVYCGDRDMFVFLVNPNRIIDDGVKGLMRGAFVSNSEVGAGAFNVKTFYLENVCGNHIVWGASQIKNVRIVHKEGAIIGAMKKMAYQLAIYADQGTNDVENQIVKARTLVLGKDQEEVVDTLAKSKTLLLSKKTLNAAYELAVQWEHTAKAAPVTCWGMVHGLTRYSQNTPYADERHDIDVAAGKILALAV